MMSMGIMLRIDRAGVRSVVISFTCAHGSPGLVFPTLPEVLSRHPGCRHGGC